MVVVDGLSMGHRLCAMPRCLNSPTDFRSKKLCPDHQREQYGLCGIVSCTRPASTEPSCTGACNMEAHQELWAAFQHTWSRETYGSYQHILQNQQGSTLRGEDGERKTSCSPPMFLESPPYVIVPCHGSLFPVASIFSLPCLWIPRVGCISIKS